MATARISTSLVYGRAMARKEAIKAERTAAKEEWIAKYMAVPQKRGWPFFRKAVLPTREEAEEYYEEGDGDDYYDYLTSPSYTHDRRFHRRAAVLDSILHAIHGGMAGDGYVTLTADECCALGFTAEAA